MPIDLMSVFSSTSTRAAKSPIGYIVGHPLWFGVVVTAVIIIMLVFWGFTGWSFKFVFYLLGSIVALLSFHDYVLDQQIKTTAASSAIGGIVQGAVGGSHAVPARVFTDSGLAYMPQAVPDAPHLGEFNSPYMS